MWLVLALLSFASFLVCAFTLTRLGFDSDGKLQQVGKPLVAGTLLLLVVWVFSLSRVEPPYNLDTLKNYEMPKETADEAPK